MTLIKKFLLAFWLPVALLAVWWLASANSSSLFFPPLERILKATGEIWFWEHIVTDLLPSLGNMLLGLGIATFLGIAIGMLIGSSPRLLALLEPGLEFFRALPAISILPILIMILGLGDNMRVTVIALGAIWPVLINATAAVKGIDPTVVDVQRAFDFSVVGRVIRTRLPAALPQILAGVRVALYISVALIVVSEMQGAGIGIGHFVLAAQRHWAVVDMWTGMIMLGLMGYGLAILFRLLERFLLRNYPPHLRGKG